MFLLLLVPSGLIIFLDLRLWLCRSSSSSSSSSSSLLLPVVIDVSGAP